MFYEYKLMTKVGFDKVYINAYLVGDKLEVGTKLTIPSAVRQDVWEVVKISKERETAPPYEPFSVTIVSRDEDTK